MPRTLLPVALTLLTAAAPASAGLRFSTSYGTEFATIGDPGNRDSLPGEGDPPPTVFYQPVGGVDYRYRVARTEVTLGQYVEFVDAYAPRYFKNSGNAIARSEFIGIGLTASPSGAAIRPGFSPDRAATMSWEYAARYVNWLHNGKVNEDWAFESGVYDTSTFTENADGSWNHQLTRDASANVWIPTRDEWTKAAYWDPDKNGGEGGYWGYPNSSDEESVPGLLPSEGGERNAGDGDAGFPLDVGSFTDVQSPWGLFDLAGGESEWAETHTETSNGEDANHRRLVMGSELGLERIR